MSSGGTTPTLNNAVQSFSIDEKSSNSSLKEEEKASGWENLTDKPLMAAQAMNAASDRDLS
jgi:hypothetical protein